MALDWSPFGGDPAPGDVQVLESAAAAVRRVLEDVTAHRVEVRGLLDGAARHVYVSLNCESSERSMEAIRRADRRGVRVDVLLFNKEPLALEHGRVIRHESTEGVIYRHFESKEQLFYEAVVEPLRAAIDELVAATEVVDRDEPLSPERQLETLTGLYRQLLSTFEEILPLLGLVLFGDPQVARRFYQDNFSVAMDRLARAWREVEDRYGVEVESPEVAARAVMGITVVLALEAHYNKKFDRERALTQASEGTMRGFFPPLTPARKRR